MCRACAAITTRRFSLHKHTSYTYLRLTQFEFSSKSYALNESGSIYFLRGIRTGPCTGERESGRAEGTACACLRRNENRSSSNRFHVWSVASARLHFPRSTLISMGCRANHPPCVSDGADAASARNQVSDGSLLDFVAIHDC